MFKSLWNPGPHFDGSVLKEQGGAVKGYEHFVKETAGQGHVREFYELKDQRLLGEDDFVEDVGNGLHEGLAFVYDIALGEILSELCSVLTVPTELIYTSNRNRLGALGRAVVGGRGGKITGQSVKAVAGHFNRDPVAITQGIKKVEERLRDENDL